MPMPWTLERLKELSTVKLESLFRNALANPGTDADEVVELVLANDMLPRVGGGLKRSHPYIQKIESICRSDAGNAAAVAAAETGEAPMAGVDPLLEEALGAPYGNYDTTGWAGSFVAEEMEALGWRRQGRKNLPPTCVAKTAALFVARTPA